MDHKKHPFSFPKTNTRKSVRLPGETISELKAIKDQFDTDVEFCIFFNSNPSTMNRAIMWQRTSPETAELIRRGIARFQKTRNCLTA